MHKFQNYIKDVIQEMKKVTWPNKDELQGSTIVVIFFAILMGVFIAGVDFLLSMCVRFFFQT
ncbi:MAG TPA: preprotein translocase subunit SecE [Fibrobacteraceae bacterium]|nr:preprotein translocase subunit SecE [Fibrobacteraceae bacterium]